MRAGLALLAGLAAAAAPLPCAARTERGPDADASGTLAEVLATRRHPWLARSSLDDVAAELARLHPAGAPATPWLPDGRPGPALAAVVRTIGDGAVLGLDPAGFGAPRLAEAVARASAGELDARERALLDLAVTVEWMRFLRAVHGGLVRSGHAGRGADLPPRTLDRVRLVRETLAGADPAAVVASVEPRYPDYARLKVALARQRALAAAPELPDVPATAGVSPGDSWSGIPAVRAHLAATGDLEPGTPPPAVPDLHDPPLVAAVRRFQERHSLAVDGVLGKATVAALNVPRARRVRQVELSLERWRWLPDPGKRAVVVQIPRAELWAIDVERGTTDLNMRTVIGESRSHATPMLSSTISSVVFRPYWVPPPRILKEEILPRARANPGWLDDHGMEIVDRPEPGAEPLPPTDDVLARVEKGELTLRQRPGPRSDLGAVKFVVPDSRCIALHGTPHGRLFALPRRERSHGCIRLEDPDGLTRWVLGREPGWDDARIAEVAGRDATTTVRLREPVPVVFVYGTAYVDPDGTEHFVEDVYRLDAKAEAELARLRTGR